MPENPANQCTSCPLVTSINEKTRQSILKERVGTFPQATDSKGYEGFQGANFTPCRGPDSST